MHMNINCRQVFFALLQSIIFFASIPASAQSYFGIGISSMALDSSYSSIGHHQKTGTSMLGGFAFSPNLDAEFSMGTTKGLHTGPTENISYPADTAEYTSVTIGLRFRLQPLEHEKFSSWIFAGSSRHFFNWDTYYYFVSGSGYALGAGLDYKLNPSWLIRSHFMKHRFSMSDTYGYGPYQGQSSEITIAAIYLFDWL